jgi:hypothetical protein
MGPLLRSTPRAAAREAPANAEPPPALGGRAGAPDAAGLSTIRPARRTQAADDPDYAVAGPALQETSCAALCEALTPPKVPITGGQEGEELCFAFDSGTWYAGMMRNNNDKAAHKCHVTNQPNFWERDWKKDYYCACRTKATPCDPETEACPAGLRLWANKKCTRDRGCACKVKRGNKWHMGWAKTDSNMCQLAESFRKNKKDVYLWKSNKFLVKAFPPNPKP